MSHTTVLHGHCNLQDFMQCGVSEQARGENVLCLGASTFAFQAEILRNCGAFQISQLCL